MKNDRMSPSSAYIVGRIPKLPPQYALIVMPLMLSVFMSGMVSFVATLKNVGWQPGLTGAWLGAWVLSWCVAFPVLLLVMPVVKRITARLVRLN